MKTALLVGPARSGTTMVCQLLNRRPGVVALDEPYRRATVAELPSRSLPDFVAAEAKRQHRLISDHGRCQTTAVDGHLGNHYNRRRGRARVATFTTVDVTDLRAGHGGPGASPVLVVKHTLLFAAQVDRLQARFPVVGLVRNPLAILLSWNSIDASYRRGLVPPYLEPHAPAIARTLAGIDDRLDRQIELLSWQFLRIGTLGLDRIVRYEDVVATGGSCLDARLMAVGIEAGSCPPSTEVLNANRSSKAGPDLIQTLAHRLVASPGPYAPFYPPAAIETLARELLAEPTTNPTANQINHPTTEEGRGDDLDRIS